MSSDPDAPLKVGGVSALRRLLAIAQDKVDFGHVGKGLGVDLRGRSL